MPAALPQPGENKTLRQKLAQNPPEVRPECCPHRDFLLPLYCSAQKEAAHVSAGDQQHQAHSRQNEYQRQLILRVQSFPPRRDYNSQPGVFFAILLPSCRATISMALCA